jgi:hypothetical protein
MMRFLLILLLQFGFGWAHSQQLSFYRESLNFELDSLRFYVSGMYFIRNLSPQVQSTSIYYPYVYETEEIDSISIYNCNTMEYLEPFAGKKGHRFKLTIPASDSVLLHIKYNHKHNGKEATYILSTTQFWKHPFQVADYTLRVTNDIKINQLFMPADSSWKSLAYTYYYWKRFNYMPEHDFKLEFQTEK